MAARALTQHGSFAAFDQLGVKNGHAGQDLAQGDDPPTLAADQGLIEGGPAPLRLPASQIVVADSTGRKLAGKWAPLVAASGQVQQSVENQPRQILERRAAEKVLK